ncbi:acyltransferase [Lacibacter sp. H375]|uniref:acyltransferase n=1 Tax=Lacibacter sp. H375 TaxID=3133424 RepID=UPI0030C265BA
MLRLFFKVKRKLNKWGHAAVISIKRTEWEALHSTRFRVGKNLFFGKKFSLYFDASSSRVQFGNDIQFRDFCQVRSGADGTLSVGNRVFFNNFCSITCFHNISIGDDCQFGEGVRFYDHNHQHRLADKPINEQGYITGAISIGNNCWFGSQVIILKDVTIGDNVIIGAGCIIHKSIPSGSVIVNKQELVTL